MSLNKSTLPIASQRPGAPSPIQNDDAPREDRAHVMDHSISHGKQARLDELSRISFLYSLSKVWPLLVAMVVLTIGAVSLFGGAVFVGAETSLQSLLGFGLRAGWLFTLVFFAYWELYRQSIRAHIDGFRIEISRGVFFTSIATAHLLPHTSFFIKQSSTFELMFNLSTLSIVLASNPDHSAASIPGLNQARAEKLRAYLGSQIDRQLGIRQPA